MAIAGGMKMRGHGVPSGGMITTTIIHLIEMESLFFRAQRDPAALFLFF
jgi:hypothetical protein